MSNAVKYFFEDIAELFRNAKQLILCCALAILGVVSGIVFFKISNYNWWYCNRCAFADKLLYGGFFTLFLSYIPKAALVCGTSFCLMIPQTQPLCFVVSAVSGIYFGANCCAVFACAGALLGVFYLPLLLAEFACNTLCCFAAVCNCPCKRAVGEAFSDNKTCLILQISSVFCKLLLIFAIIRPITSLI